MIKNKLQGYLIGPSMVFLLICVTMITYQMNTAIEYIKIYNSQKNYNIAFSLKNIAISNELGSGKTLSTNQGKISYNNHRYEVILSNGMKYSFEDKN